MKKRITVSMKRDLERTIRQLQSQLIEESGESISFSKTLEIIIQKALDGNYHSDQIILDYMYNKQKTV